jgi:hypothetical protein
MKKECRFQGALSSRLRLKSINSPLLFLRHIITQYFAIFEPRLVRQRKANRLKRRRYWAAGSNDIWATDQHDKWKHYGLKLHIGLDPFIGRIQWLKIWWTNSNPKLILDYYLEAITGLGCKNLLDSKFYCHHSR